MVSLSVEQMKRALFSVKTIDRYAGDEWRGRNEYTLAFRKGNARKLTA